MEIQYDVETGGVIRFGLEESDIWDMYHRGQIHRDDRCRVQGGQGWATINECLPLLKYGVDRSFAPERQRASASRPLDRKHLLVVGALTLIALSAVGIGFYYLPTIQGAATAESSSATESAPSQPSAPSPPQTAQNSAPQMKSYSFGSRGITSNSAPAPAPLERPYVRPLPRSSEPTYAARPTAPPPRPQPKSEEYTIPLGVYYSLGTSYGSLGLKIVDHGPVTMSVWINGSGPARIEKVKGFDRDNNNLTKIYRFPRATVYYVDRVGVSLGNYVIRVVADA